MFPRTNQNEVKKIWYNIEYEASTSRQHVIAGIRVWRRDDDMLDDGMINDGMLDDDMLDDDMIDDDMINDDTLWWRY